ncbi:MAG TPA: diguanylate cyclase [Solirubrobacteraceae bacterium]|jgi:diguanylate cyclase (GGDEF)-like protein|nr:diguanylate cyclase [Solirubrobacteraceae bacterium]
MHPRSLIARLRLRIGARFVIVLGLLVVGTGLLGGIALTGLGALSHSNAGLRAAVTESTTDSDVRADAILFGGELQLYFTATDPALRKALDREIEPRIVDIEAGLAAMFRAYRANPAALRIARQHERPYRRLLAVWRRDSLDVAPLSATAREQLTARLHEHVNALVAAGDRMQVRDARVATAAAAAAARRYRETRNLIVESLAALLLVSVMLAVWLVRSVVPRARRYAAFASRVSDGELGARLEASGSDELDDLGRSLDGLVATRQVAEEYAETQTEFTDALQVADGEEEAHLVLRAHLQRSIADSSVVVLNRNNSADRLEARTPVAAGSALEDGLSGAGPRDCLAVRLARPQRTDPSRPAPLMPCQVCGKLPGAVGCNPLLVGGEVIGSVLVTRPAPLTAADDRRLQDTVIQAAPVLANLRNLAIAEMRAATDALTGLPNSRAVRDTVKRMAALAGRTSEPLAAAMLDLDHFKQINDQFGHGRGDDVLAAVGAVLRERLRASDFVGRLGGEEFVMLLPATSRDGAVEAAEKLRAAVESISVPGVERKITVSIGIALIPDNAGDADGLLREADRALYAAKEAGRNRVVVAVPSEAAAARRKEAANSAN